jgi:hypothetical protein
MTSVVFAVWGAFWGALAFAAGLSVWHGRAKRWVVATVLPILSLVALLVVLSLPGFDLVRSVADYGLARLVTLIGTGAGSSFGTDYATNFMRTDFLIGLTLDAAHAVTAAVVLVALARKWPAPRAPTIVGADHRFGWGDGTRAADMLFAAAVAELVLFGFVWMILPIDDLGFGSTAMQNTRTDLEGLLWVGLPLCLLGMSRAATVYAAPDRSEDGAHRAAAAEEGSLADLYERYRSDGGDLVLFAGRVERRRDDAAPTKVVAAESERSVARRFQMSVEALGLLDHLSIDASAVRVIDTFWQSRDLEKDPQLLLPEDLGRLHFLLLAELMRSAQDRGGVTLIVVPHRILEAVDRALVRAMQENCAEIPHTVWRAGTPLDETGHHVALLVSDQTFDNFLNDNGRVVARTLERLDLIAVLDFPGLDAALLRLRLARLRMRLAPRVVSSLKVVCQGRETVDMGNSVNATFGVLGNRLFVSLWLRRGGQSDRYVVVVPDDVRSFARFGGDDGLRHHLTETAPVLLFPAMRMGFRSHFHDRYGRVERRLWNERLQSSIRAIGDGDGQKRWLDHTPRVSLLFTRDQGRVTLVEDLANLGDALAVDADFDLCDQTLRIVLCSDYPLRDFLVQKMRDTSGGGIAAYSPMAPLPRGGIVEIAQVLMAEFLRRGDAAGAASGPRGVAQSEVEMLFAPLSEAVAAEYEIHPTRQGIERLFEIVFGQHVGVIAETFGAHQIAFRLVVRDPQHLQSRLHVPVRTDAQSSEPIGYLLRSDRGLTWGNGSRITLAAEFYDITKVEAGRVVVQSHQVDGALRERNHFARNYTLHVDGRPFAIEEASDRRYGNHRRLVFARLIGTVTRRSVALLRVPEAVRPLQARVPQWETGPQIFHTQELPACSVLAIRLVVTGRSGGDEEAKVSAEIAFTLAATLQDLLQSLFPLAGRRIAVVSPHAGPAIATVLTASDIDRLPADLHPRLVDAAAVSTRDTAPADPAAWSEALSSSLTSGRSLGPDVLLTASETSVLDLLVIEDAAYDMGVGRRLVTGWPTVLERWTDYLRWLAEDPSHVSHHGYGGTRPSKIFDFSGAAALLARLHTADD